MKALVTGATGFLGSHVARRLLARGVDVRVLLRSTSRTENLENLMVERALGDLRDADSLKSAMQGIDVLFHVAADYRLATPDPESLYAINVEGSELVLRAAREAGVGRVVYTSSVSAIGIPKDGTPGTEDTPVGLDDMVGHYKRSKYLGQQVAERCAREGQDIVIVNPSTPVGTHDIKPTQTGQVIVDFLNGRMPAYVETGLNIVDAEDVAEGHLLAWERGERGRVYILGNRDMYFKQLLDVLAAVSGFASPKVRLPYHLALAIGAIDTGVSRVLGKPPRVPLEGVRMARKCMFFSAARAVRELGLPQTPPELALEKAVRWFVDHGYITRPLPPPRVHVVGRPIPPSPTLPSPTPPALPNSASLSPANASRGPVLVCVACPEEAAPVRALCGAARQRWSASPLERGVLAGREVVLLTMGVGPQCAARSVRRALAEVQPAFVVVLGLAGGLRPELERYAVVAASAVQDGEGGEVFAADPQLLEGVHSTPLCGGIAPGHANLLSLPRVAGRRKERERLAEQAAMVDMESATVARLARGAGVPFVALRVISDTATDDLVFDFNACLGSDGAISRSRVALAAARQPWLVPELLGLQQASIRASSKLASYFELWMAHIARRTSL